MARCAAVEPLSASATVNLSSDVYTVDASGGNVTVTLPDFAKLSGLPNSFRRVDNSGNTVTLQPQPGQTVDGVSSRTLPPLSGVQTMVTSATEMATTLGHALSNSATALEAIATSDTTTTSSSDVLMDSMSLTPTVSGRYLVMASTSLRNSSVLATVTLALYVNGSVVSASTRVTISATQTLVTLLGTSPVDQAVHTHALVNALSGQAIELRWRTSAGTATAHQRTLDAVRVY